MSFNLPPGHVFYRRETHPHPTIARGTGVYLYDTAGRRYLDASGGALVVNLGHGVGTVVEAMARQAAQVAYIHARMFTSQPLEDYAAALAQIVTLSQVRFFFLNSGSEAVETALKLARQIQLEGGQANRYLIISRWGSYHGTTLGALAVTGKPKSRQPYQPMLPPGSHIPPPYCYRCPFGLAYPDCDLRCAEALEQEIKRVGVDNVAAFIAEPISGATLGAVVPPDEYWPRIRQICDAYGLLLIADEVLTGFGRTGRWFAIDHWAIQPDLMTMGKGSTGGYFPFSITALRGNWFGAIVEGSGTFVHGGTFSHHAVGAAVALATLGYLQKHDLVTAAYNQGVLLGQRLHTALAALPWVGDIRGRGLLWGVEFVADQTSKRPFPASMQFAQRVADAAFKRGLIVYPSSGCADGEEGDLVLLGPPLTVTEEQIEELVSLLYEAIVAVGPGKPGKPGSNPK